MTSVSWALERSLDSSNQRLAFHWENVDAERLLRIRFDEYGWQWSGGFPIDSVGEFSVRLRNTHTHSQLIANVDVRVDGATIVVTFAPSPLP